MLAKITLLLVLFLLSAPTIAAPLNLRHPAPSPNGTRICFSHAGDLWLVSASGGRAERLTAHVGYDAYPVWSPDGQYIAFSSSRNGNFDVYLIAAEGGKERRVTYYSGDDFVSGWTPDSKKILFDSRRELHEHCIFQVNPFDLKPKPITRIESFQGRMSPDGKRLLFCRGAVPWWRKGYRGPAACDLFIKQMDNGQIGQFTAHNSNDLEGFWMPGGDEIVYLSDSTGSYNLFKRNIQTGSTDQLTRHLLNASFPSLAADGSLLCYELGGEIWLYDFRTGFGSKLTVTVPASMKLNPVERNIYDSGATEMALSPDGSMIAFVVAGDIFCISVDGRRQQQLTNTAADERDISWSSDSRELTFVSNRENGYDVYRMSSGDPEEPSLARSLFRETSRLMESDRWESLPLISPDNRKVAFVRSLTDLMVTDNRGMDGRKLSEKHRVNDLAWSPDGRYLIFTLVDSDWFKDVYIADSESGNIINVTLNPGNYSRPRFSADGKMVYFLSDGHINYLFLQRELAEMSPRQRREFLDRNGNGNSEYQPVQIDFEQISTRIESVEGAVAAENAVVAKGCRTMYYTTGNGDIREYDLDNRQSRLFAENLDFPSALQIDYSSHTLFFSDRSGRFHSIEIGENRLRSHSYRVRVRVNLQEQCNYLFDQVWGLVQQRFYDESLHGVDWGEIGKAYRQRAQVVETREDLYDIIREMLGELNASHLGIWPGELSGDQSGCLGIIPDYENSGNGIKIEGVIPETPAAQPFSSLKRGEKISEINGDKIEQRERSYLYLEGSAGIETLVDLVTREGLTKKVAITPISISGYRELELAHWAQQNRELVTTESKGAVGYIYLHQLDDATVDAFGHELALHAAERKALIIDIRGNVGGSAHDRLLDLLSNRTYINRVPRNGLPGEDSRTLFDGRIVLLVDERTSSDAEIFAFGFRQLGLGSVLGSRTYGAVIGTETLTLLDGSKLGLPSVGWYTLSGENLENRGIEPDIAINSNLTLLESGEDSQLRQAVSKVLDAANR